MDTIVIFSVCVSGLLCKPASPTATATDVILLTIATDVVLTTLNLYEYHVLERTKVGSIDSYKLFNNLHCSVEIDIDFGFIVVALLTAQWKTEIVVHKQKTINML